MGRMYRGRVAPIAVTALQDLFELLAPTDAVVIVHRWNVFQTSDVGDAAEEILRLLTVSGIGSVTSGSGGTTVTVQTIHDGDAAFGGTLEANNTTRMVVGTGTLKEKEEGGWNIRQEYPSIYTPEERPIISPGNRWTLALPAAPADSLTLGLGIVFEAIGG